MKFADFICFDAVIAQLEANDRDGAIAELVSALDKTGNLGKAKCQDIVDAVVKRENEASTGIGKGVAVPHVKHDDIKKVVAVVGLSRDGIDFSSLDKQPAYTIILLASPASDPDKHLQAMEKIFRNLQKDDFRKFLRQAMSVEQIKEAIIDHDV
ncbi:MAG: PTS sugar transporter subunit IIA [Planctomycetes bacterium]|nr:PTS sugar transporter subunit IIA [Planctomycetota bacterium]